MEEKQLAAIVAANLIELRKGAHLTQSELGSKFGYSDKSISKWEQGNAIPSAPVLMELASFYNVTVDFLLTSNDFSKMKRVRKDVRNKKNWIILAAMLICFFFTIAAVVFGSQIAQGVETAWVSFMFAIPVSLLSTSYLIYKNLGRKNVPLFISNSAFLWTTLLAFYLAFMEMNLWYMFIAGLPVQAILILMVFYN